MTTILGLRKRCAMPRGNAGFSIVEMIITVAVMAILIGITTPSIFEFMRQKDEQSEEIAMNEVRKAMLSYLADTGELPSDTTTTADPIPWYTKLAGYTSLSAEEIDKDVWGRPRRYILYTDTSREMFGNKIMVYYATIHSAGLNGKAENTYLDNTATATPIIGMAVSSGAFAVPTSTSWWKKLGTATSPSPTINAFSGLRAGGDDHLMRFTNYDEMRDRYNVTMQRLDRLTQALETYARSGYAARIALCSGSSPDPALCDNGAPEKTIYYPRSKSTSGSAAENADVKYSDSAIIVDNTTNVKARRTQMIQLMNRLGLPADYCCSALEVVSTGVAGEAKIPVPFYYFSNPRARTDTACSTRPRFNDPKLPARISTKNNSDSSTERTCG